MLEAAYAFDLDEKAWLVGLCDALLPYQLGRGVAAYTAMLGDEVGVRTIASRELHVPEASVHVLAKMLPAAMFRRIHAPLPASFGGDLFPEAASEIRTTVAKLVGRVADVFPQSWAIAGGDPGRESVLVAFHCDVREDLEDRDRHVLDHLGAHLGAALRLRSLHASAPTGHAPTVDAVFAPDGHILDLRGDAEAERETLVQAVRRSERAKLRSAAPEERLELWTALVEGRWSIIESTESDGKRVMLACRNEPHAAYLRALTKRERTVAEYASLGHSFKYMAYELGVSISTAAADLESALKKLGLTTRADLIRLFAAAPRSP